MNTLNRLTYLKTIDNVIASGPFSDTWDSLSAFRVPEWYAHAKFGIFIHWGVYSVPAFGNEWYPRNMYKRGSPEFEHHVNTYGPHKAFGYKDFIPLFKAEKFDTTNWADLFAQAGAKYVVPVAEHHDGFQMYQSDLSEWNAAEKGPHRDVLGELRQALAQRGITFGASTHRVEHWFFMGHGKEFESDIHEPLRCGDFYWPAQTEGDQQDLFSQPAPSAGFMEDWLMRCCEIVDNYRPKLIFFDWWIQQSAVKPYLRKFAAYYYNRAAHWGDEVVITYKHDAFPFGCAVPDVERGQFADIKPFFWQADTTVAKDSWCYTEGNTYKNPRDLICDLCDIVSKNGVMLLNIGPKADGTIPHEDAGILREIGAWLRVNGEAIYGTSCWRTSGEGPVRIREGHFTDGEDRGFTSRDIRFTIKGNKLYAIVLAYPADGKVCISSLAKLDPMSLPSFSGIIKGVDVLGFDEKPLWQRDEKGLSIQTHGVAGRYPVVFRVTID